ncbi:MAG: prepilin-type N-terminal cleavage/methylation domain-containing protein [Deltaproteobacteria bacterium]|nr:prepilin-type N-terminal cleavage/methylation domain-containing protein [Deltaproteobacteria bacterium]
MTRKDLGNSGFTLLEIMVAVSIIAIVFVSIFRMHSQTLSMSHSVRFFTSAPLLAQKVLAEAEAKSSEDLISDSGDFRDGFTGYRWRISVEDVESDILGETAKDLKKIDITVSDGNNENLYLLRTYRFIRIDE